MNDLVEKYIAYPMAIKVLQQDFESFRYFEVGRLYMSLVESVIERMQEDFYKLKSELYTVHHLDIKRLDSGKYKANNDILEFTPGELKEMTHRLMSSYLNEDDPREFNLRDRPWNPKEQKWEK